jgi:hypothetical protein
VSGDRREEIGLATSGAAPAASACTSPASSVVSGSELPIRFYGTGPGTLFAAGVPEPSYNTWNVGVGFTYKVFTLDLRYSDTNLSKASCNVFTGDYVTRNVSPSVITPTNPGGFGSDWCGAAGIVKLSADLTAMTSLK